MLSKFFIHRGLKIEQYTALQYKNYIKTETEQNYPTESAPKPQQVTSEIFIAAFKYTPRPSRRLEHAILVPICIKQLQLEVLSLNCGCRGACADPVGRNMLPGLDKGHSNISFPEEVLAIFIGRLTRYVSLNLLR